MQSTVLHAFPKVYGCCRYLYPLVHNLSTLNIDLVRKSIIFMVGMIMNNANHDKGLDDGNNHYIRKDGTKNCECAKWKIAIVYVRKDTHKAKFSLYVKIPRSDWIGY